MAETDGIEEAKRRIAEGGERLDLRDLRLMSLEPLAADLAKVNSVVILDLAWNSIADIAPIAGMTGIKSLDLSHTQITDIAAISGMTGITTLDLRNTQITDITPVAPMTRMTALSLSNTQITDIAPIAGMTGITRLYLSGTQITDLRPIRGLTQLVEAPSFSGLQFKNTPACTLDPKIAEIAEVKDNADRARQLFAYLENWVPPGEESDDYEPADTDLLPSTIVEGRLETALSHPTEEELDDHLKRIMHQRLRSDLQDLAEAASNYFPKTFQKACRLRDRLKPEFEDLDMLNIHQDVEALRQLRLRGQESDLSDPFPQDVLDALDAVSASGPGLTLDNPDVEKLIKKIRRFRNDPLPSDVQAKHDALSQATASDDAAIGENLRAVEKRTDEAETPAEKLAIQDPLHRGMIVRLGRWALSGGTIVVGAVVVDLIKAPIVAYVQANMPLLWDVAGLYGAKFQIWFGMALSELKEFAGPLAAIEFKPTKRPER